MNSDGRGTLAPRQPDAHRDTLGRRRESMMGFDYDVAIVGSGLGGSVAALRAAEKGYRVGVMEAGRRWEDEDSPKTQWDLPHFLWLPGAESYGIQRVEYLDDMLILPGAGWAAVRRACSPEACSSGRRSCANATAPGSTSPAEP